MESFKVGAIHLRTRQSSSVLPRQASQEDVINSRESYAVLRAEALSALSAIEKVALCIEEHEQRGRRITGISSEDLHKHLHPSSEDKEE